MDFIKRILEAIGFIPRVEARIEALHQEAQDALALAQTRARDIAKAAEDHAKESEAAVAHYMDMVRREVARNHAVQEAAQVAKDIEALFEVAPPSPTEAQAPEASGK